MNLAQGTADGLASQIALASLISETEALIASFRYDLENVDLSDGGRQQLVRAIDQAIGCLEGRRAMMGVEAIRREQRASVRWHARPVARPRYIRRAIRAPRTRARRRAAAALARAGPSDEGGPPSESDPSSALSIGWSS